MLQDISIILYMGMYICMFASAIELRRSQPDVARPIRITGLPVIASVGIARRPVGHRPRADPARRLHAPCSAGSYAAIIVGRRRRPRPPGPAPAPLPATGVGQRRRGRGRSPSSRSKSTCQPSAKGTPHHDRSRHLHPDGRQEELRLLRGVPAQGLRTAPAVRARRDRREHGRARRPGGARRRRRLHGRARGDGPLPVPGGPAHRHPQGLRPAVPAGVPAADRPRAAHGDLRGRHHAMEHALPAGPEEAERALHRRGLQGRVDEGGPRGARSRRTSASPTRATR